MTVIAVYVPSMMDRSRLENTWPDAAFVASAEQLTLVDADLFVLDLDAAGSLDVVGALAAEGRVIGFGRHTNEATLEAAELAGCEAMPRSTFFRRLPSL